MHGGGGLLLTGAAKHADIRFAGKRLKCTISEIRSNDDFDKLLVYDRRGNVAVDILAEGNNATET